MKIRDYKMEDLKIGDKDSFDVIISESSQSDFASLSGDFNPLHTDFEYAKTTKMGRPVVYGMYLASLVSRLIGMNLPGKRSLIVDSHFNFHKPAFVADNVRVYGEISQVSLATRLVNVQVRIDREEDLLMDGYVSVMLLS